MKDINYILAPYDSSSRISGTSKSLQSWLKILQLSEKKVIARELGDLLPYILEHEVKKCVSNNKLPIIIGGDHSLTYYTCKALTSIYNKLNIIIFDAHHDSYEKNFLNHYTVFHFCKKYLGANIIHIGCRKDLQKPPYLDLSKIEFPCYISVDVDYFAPEFIPSVMDPVQCDLYNNYSLENYRTTLETIPENVIVGADIVEWIGSEENSDEYKFMENVHEILIKNILLEIREKLYA